MKVAMIAILMGIATIAVPLAIAQPTDADPGVAVFAGGCFWCMEPPFDKIDGVRSTISGYIGGSAEDATYQRVLTGRTGHYEAVRIEYDPEKVDYTTLLEVFWQNVDPFDSRGQFCDKGPQYLAAIFPLTATQRKLAEESKAAAAEKVGGAKIETEILPARTFYPAEDYHQDYYKKNAARYKFYRWNCGRDRRLRQVWGDS